MAESHGKAEPYQDPDPVSTNQTKAPKRKDSTASKAKKRFRNPFARFNRDNTQAAEDAAAARTAPPPPTTTTYSNPFTTDTDADDVTLVNKPLSYDPDAEFHHSPERWTFRLKQRQPSVSASDVGMYARATTVDERNAFTELMEMTRGMSPEELQYFLSKRQKVDGEKIMNGRKGSGYQMLSGPFMGTM